MVERRQAAGRANALLLFAIHVSAGVRGDQSILLDGAGGVCAGMPVESMEYGGYSQWTYSLPRHQVRR